LKSLVIFIIIIIILYIRQQDFLIWFRSVDGSVIFSAPALPDEDSLVGDLAVSFRASDPGLYDVNIVVAESAKVSEGARGTFADIRPLREGPWKLYVHSDDTKHYMPSSVKTKFLLPSNFCDAIDYSEGRWVKCEAANIKQENCLLDGWVFVPHECRYLVLSPEAVLSRSKIARSSLKRPLWIAFLGSSIARGTFHSMVDRMTGIRFEASSNEFVRDAIFNTPSTKQNKPGEGSTRKCWGWSDVQVGHLRMSFSDFRMVYMDREYYGPQLQMRFEEIIQEGPDMIVVEVNFQHNFYILKVFTAMVVTALKHNPNWRGTLVLSYQKMRFNSGGIKSAFDNTMSYSSSKIFESAIMSTKRHIQTELSNCAECSHMTQSNAIGTDKARIIFGDELLMAWAFVFDMEVPMSSKSTAQHFHYYKAEKGIRSDFGGICGERNRDGRIVFGAVPEMASIMYLHMLLKFTGVGQASLTTDSSICSHAQRLPNTQSKNMHAPLVTTAVCADCPLYLSVPGKEFRWEPPKSNPYSITDIHKGGINISTTKELRNLGMQECYRSPTLLVDAQKSLDRGALRSEDAHSTESANNVNPQGQISSRVSRQEPQKPETAKGDSLKAKLAELKELFDLGLISAVNYDASQRLALGLN
jgi:hypothetical protein